MEGKEGRDGDKDERRGESGERNGDADDSLRGNEAVWRVKIM